MVKKANALIESMPFNLVCREQDKKVEFYLTGSRWFEGEDVGQSGDDIDSETHKERSDGGVDGPKEREDDGKKPDGDDHRQSRRRTLAKALALVHPYRFLPHEVQRRACESKGDELQQHHNMLWLFRTGIQLENSDY